MLQDAVYAEDHELWDLLKRYRSHIEHYFEEISLDLVVHEHDGFAYLKQSERDDGIEVPRLFRRDKLTRGVALVGVVLRERLLQFDEKVHDEGRLIVDTDEIVQMVAALFPETNDEVQGDKRIEGAIKRAEDLGLLRKVPSDSGAERYEVRRIIKARFPVETLKVLRDQLANHAHARNSQ